MNLRKLIYARPLRHAASIATAGDAFGVAVVAAGARCESGWNIF